MAATADLFDEHGDALQSCTTQFQRFARSHFDGPVRTVRCLQDNQLVKQLLATDGAGAVLVIDGGGSLESALMGDLIAQSAVDNGWAGVIVHGAIRDSATIDTLPIGVKALGTNPRKSAKDGAGAIDVDVRFGGVTFRPGAHLWSDEDGILVER